MRKAIVVLLWGGLVGVGGCAHVNTPASVAPQGDYRLGADDVIEVAVWKEPALSASVPVRPDGKISLPMVGELAAQGRTAEELRLDITERLRSSIHDPVVSVMVKEVHAARFFVLGEVTHPGAFPLTAGTTILQAISVAGGPTEFARKGSVVVIRHGEGVAKAERLRVDFDDVLSGRVEPVPLAAGDTIYVP